MASAIRQKETANMTEGSIARHLLTFAFPLLLGNLFQQLYNTVDTWVVGNFASNEAFSAVGSVASIINVLIGLFMGLPEDWVLIVGGALVVLMGIGLVVYYMGYGVFYDENSFLFMTLGKQTKTYYYNAIRAQQLYNNQGHLLIELHMSDGNVIQLQSTMNGCYEFMDHAFAAWLKQTGKKKEDCPYYDPDNSCWFPPVNEEK